MKRLTAQLIFAAATLAPASMFAQYTEGIITVPGSTIGTASPYGIDDNNQVAGTFGVNLVSHGFLWSQGVLSQVDQPGASETFVYGINSVKGVVGAELTSRGTFGMDDAGRRFIREAGGSGKYITGINASGTFVGYDTSEHAFINVGGVYTNVVPAPCAALPPPLQIYITAVNANNDFVGYCYGSQFPAMGFARINGVDQQITAFGDVTFPLGINDSGTIAGWFNDSTGSHGFIMTGTNVTQFDVSGANYLATKINGINNKGSLVGTTLDANIGYFVAFYALAN